MGDLISIILAAGKGTRMRSDLPKVLHKICGRPMLDYVVGTAGSLGMKRIIVVVGHKAEMVERYLDSGLESVRQKVLLGTADAVLKARTRLKNSKRNDDILILYGDTPLLSTRTLKRLILRHKRDRASCTLLTAILNGPSDYGRILRDGKGRILRIVERIDASSGQRAIREVNVGAYCFRAKDLFDSLRMVRPQNLKGEYYLTDVISILSKRGLRVSSVTTKDSDEILGINSREDLARARSVIRCRTLTRLMSNGVTILDPPTTYIEEDARIGKDTVIYPLTIIEGDVRIGRNCEVGPLCRIRSGTRLKDNVKIGNFVEVVRSNIGQGSRAKHHTYLGDAVVGEDVNIGAGTIVANYDGRSKSKTHISSGAFIGSGTILIAPVKVGKGAVTGAGCVVTKGKDVPANTVVVGVPARALRKMGTKG